MLSLGSGSPRRMSQVRIPGPSFWSELIQPVSAFGPQPQFSRRTVLARAVSTSGDSGGREKLGEHRVGAEALLCDLARRAGVARVVPFDLLDPRNSLFRRREGE